MVDNKEADLGLSLSINLSQHNIQKQHHHHQQQNTCQNQHQCQMQAQNINLFPSFFNSITSAGLQQKASWNPFSSATAGLPDQTHTSSTRPLQKGIDVNSLPSTEDYADDAGAASPNSTISSQSGKRSERETDNHADHLDSEDEDGENSRKKLRLSKDQSAILEETFKDHNTLNPKQKMILAKQLGLRPRQVEVWFQNRRARTKLKQTEVDCEFLKRCCENLTEENRRLQKEVHELRALKMSPQFYMQMAPPTTLTMCPSCERVGGPNNQSGAGRVKNVAGASHWTVTARALDGIRPRS